MKMKVTNADYMESARDHPLRRMIGGRVCHLTTPQNFQSIIEEGWIKAETSRNGVFPRHKDASPSVCMSHGAVSVFDLGIPWESLTPLSPEGDGYMAYDLNWWSFFHLRTEAVVILLDDSVRTSFLLNPTGDGQIIHGGEYCHQGDISTDAFTGFILRTGSLYDPASYSLSQYSAHQHRALLQEVATWTTRLDFIRELMKDQLGLSGYLDDMTLMEMELTLRGREFPPAE